MHVILKNNIKCSEIFHKTVDDVFFLGKKPDHWEDFYDYYATTSDFESQKLKSRCRLTVVDSRLTADRLRNFQLKC